MPRIRTIKPELWESPDVLPQDDAFQALWCWLISNADDAGRFRGNAKHIADRRRRSVKVTEERLRVMEDQGMIMRYEDGGRDYIALINWSTHQYIPHPAASKLPPPPTDPFMNPHENDMNPHEDSGVSAHARADRIGSEQTPPISPPRGEPQRWRRQKPYVLAEQYDRIADALDAGEL